VRHLGPVAQDFRAAFGLGSDDTSIGVVDASGVALASIQALYQMMLEKDRQNQELNRKVGRLQAQLNQVRRAVRGRGRKR
jgi:trimeric autotransporter adhesin